MIPLRTQLHRAWCWLWHRRDWAASAPALRVCNRCGEVWAWATP